MSTPQTEHIIDTYALLHAPSVDTPMADWQAVGETAGGLTMTPELALYLVEAAQAHGPIAAHGRIGGTFQTNLLHRSVAALAETLPGAIKVGADAGLTLPRHIATVTPRAWALVPTSEITFNDDVSPQAFWGAAHAFLFPRAVLEVLGAVGIHNGLSGQTDPGVQVTFRGLSGSPRYYFGKTFAAGVALGGLRLAYTPSEDALTPALRPAGTGAGTFTRASGARYLNADGTIVAVGNDVPRYQDGGLLLEPLDTNAIEDAEALDAVSWELNEATVTPDDAPAPDGTHTADKLVESAANANHFARQTLASAAGTVYALCAVFSPDERHNAQLRANENIAIANYAAAEWNLRSGALRQTVENGDFTVIRTHIRAVATGYLCTLVYQTGALASSTQVVNRALVLDDDGVENYLGDGVSGVHVWGMQRTDHLSSYIPTSGGAVVRQPDKLTLALPEGYAFSGGVGGRGLTLYGVLVPRYDQYEDLAGLRFSVGADHPTDDGAVSIQFRRGTTKHLVRLRKGSTVEDHPLAGPEYPDADTEYEVTLSVSGTGQLTLYRGDTEVLTANTALLADGDAFKNDLCVLGGGNLVLKDFAIAEGVYRPSEMRGTRRST